MGSRCYENKTLKNDFIHENCWPVQAKNSLGF
jgi:hypothetical protein